MVADVSDWILSLHGWVALGIVFLLPALESSTFVGLVFPGEIAVVLGGVLASQGRVSLAAAIIAASLGAIVGDSIGYAVGRSWGDRIYRVVGRRVPFVGRRIDQHLRRARAFMKRRGGVSVLLGRFTAALRVMVPGLAGMSEMSYTRFALYTVIGAVAWAASFVILGYFAGAAWERAAKDAEYLGITLLGVIVVGLVAARILRRRAAAWRRSGSRV